MGADARQRGLDEVTHRAAQAEAEARARTLEEQQALLLARAGAKVMDRDREKWEQAQKRATLAREEEDAEEAWRKKDDKG
jgi:hypothetical protein